MVHFDPTPAGAGLSQHLDVEGGRDRSLSANDHHPVLLLPLPRQGKRGAQCESESIANMSLEENVFVLHNDASVMIRAHDKRIPTCQ